MHRRKLRGTRVASNGGKVRMLIIHGLNIRYCRMLLTRHYDQRPFDKTVCDAIITNGGVKNHQKRCKTFVMMDASNTV